MIYTEDFDGIAIVQQLRATGLNVGTVLQEPWVYPCALDPALKNSKSCHGGMAVELTDTFCHQLRIQCRYLVQNFSDGVHAETNTALLERIIAGADSYGEQLDTAIPILVQTPRFSQYLNFTMPVFYMELAAMIKTEYWERNDELYFVLRPFHWSLWLLLVFTVLLVSCMEAYYQLTFSEVKIEQSKRRSYFSFLSNSWVLVFAILMSRSMDTPVPQISRRILMFTWGLACIIVVNVYCGQLVSTKVAAKEQKPFSNMKEFTEKLASKQIHLVIYSPDSKFVNDVMTEAKVPYLSLHEALQANPPDYVDNLSNFTNVLTDSSDSRRLVLFASQFTLRALAKGNCNVSIVPLGVTDFGSFAFLPDNNYASLFSRVILGFKERGYYMDVLEHKYNFGRDCESRDRDSPRAYGRRHRFVNLASLVVAFWVLGIGSLLATFAFSLEHASEKNKTHTL